MVYLYNVDCNTKDLYNIFLMLISICCCVGTVKALITDPLKADYLSTADMSPRFTLANTQLPPKMDSETKRTNSFVHNANAC